MLTTLHARIIYLFATYTLFSWPTLSCIQAQKSAYVSYHMLEITNNCSWKTFPQPLKFPLEMYHIVLSQNCEISSLENGAASFETILVVSSGINKALPSSY